MLLVSKKELGKELGKDLGIGLRGIEFMNHK